MLVFVSVSLNNMPMLLLLYFSVLVIFYGTWDFAFFCKFYPSTHTHRYMLTHHANLFPILPPSKELYCTFAEIIIHKGMEANACVQLTISKGYLSEIDQVLRTWWPSGLKGTPLAMLRVQSPPRGPGLQRLKSSADWEPSYSKSAWRICSLLGCLF